MPEYAEKTKSRQRKIYEIVLTFLGAAIILSTFIVKDTIKEGIKDKSSTIESARNLFLLRREMLIQRAFELSMLPNSAVPESLPPTCKPPASDANAETIREYCSGLYSSLQKRAIGTISLLQSMTDMEMRLMGDLEETGSEVQRMEELKAQLDSVAKQLRTLEGQLVRQGAAQSVETEESSWGRLIQSMTQVAQTGIERADEFQKKTDEGLKRADHSLELQKTKYELFKKRSIYLYLSGFVIVLIAKVTGVDVMGG